MQLDNLATEGVKSQQVALKHVKILNAIPTHLNNKNGHLQLASDLKFRKIQKKCIHQFGELGACFAGISAKLAVM